MGAYFWINGTDTETLVNLLVNLSNEYPWVTRILLFLLLIAVYFIHKHPIYIILIVILLAEPFIKE